MSTISVILFDLGRVLVDLDFDAFPRLLGLERSPANRTDEKAIEQIVVQYETGTITTGQFFDSLDDILHHKFSRKQMLNAWNAIIGKENSAIVPIVESVMAQHKIAILSNTSPTHFRKAVATSPIVSKFSTRYLSYEIGAMKPELSVYRHVIHDLNVDPSAILFIDDISENILAAQKCRMKGALFTGVPELVTVLRSRRIL